MIPMLLYLPVYLVAIAILAGLALYLIGRFAPLKVARVAYIVVIITACVAVVLVLLFGIADGGA